MYFEREKPVNERIYPKHPVTMRLRDILSDSDGLLTLVKLNFLFIVTCAFIITPASIFTIGPSMAAMGQCFRILVKNGSVTGVSKTYFSAFRTNMKKSAALGAILYVMTAVFLFGFYFYITMAAENILYVPFASLSLITVIALWCVATHLFPAAAESENSTLSLKELIIFSANQAVLSMKNTLIAVILGLIIIAAMVLLLPTTFPIILTFAFSVAGLAGGFAHTEPEFYL